MIRISEKRGLCSDGLLFCSDSYRRGGGHEGCALMAFSLGDNQRLGTQFGDEAGFRRLPFPKPFLIQDQTLLLIKTVPNPSGSLL